MPGRLRPGFNAHYAENGWPGLTAPEAYGGQGLDALTLAVTSEIYSGACHSLQMVSGLVPGAVRTLLRFGTEDQKTAYIPMLASGECPGHHVPDGTGGRIGPQRHPVQSRSGMRRGWTISGERKSLSRVGDQNVSDKILHLVLARTGDDNIRGLSLFLCRSEKADKHAKSCLRHPDRGENGTACLTNLPVAFRQRGSGTDRRTGSRAERDVHNDESRKTGCCITGRRTRGTGMGILRAPMPRNVCRAERRKDKQRLWPTMPMSAACWMK